MKILIQIPQLIFGGAEKVLVSFANDLVSRGHDVTVLETYEKGLLKDQFDKRVKFDAICSKAYTKKYYASLADVKKNPLLLGKLIFSKIVGYEKFAQKLCSKKYTNKKFDIAINYLEIENPKFLLNSIKAKKYIQWYHTDVANLDHPEDADKMLDSWKRMDAIICVSKISYENFINRYNDLKDKTYLIYNFFDSQEIEKKSQESFIFETTKPVLLSVGRMTEPKKYLRFLKVIKKLCNEGYEFSWHVLGNGIQKGEIEQKIKDYNLENIVYLDGLTDNPYKYMKNCDLFVLPSGWEGFPTVTVEAKVLKCPILATDVAGIREQIVHGETGWIVDNNEDSIYNGLKHLLENPQIIKKIKDNSGIEKIVDSNIKYKEFMDVCK